MLHTKFRENRPAGSGEEDFYKHGTNILIRLLIMKGLPKAFCYTVADRII